MAQPELFPRVLSWSMGLITGMYLLTAVFGYWAYGDTTVSPILNNLPKGIVAKFSIFVITAHVLLAIPILLTSFAIEVNDRERERRREVAMLDTLSPKPLPRSKGVINSTHIHDNQ